MLTSATGGVTLGYDPALRLYQTVGAATTRFLYDGVDAIAEYNGSNALQRRFVFDPTTGQPVLWYEGTGTAATNRRYLGQDERGSVISVADSAGASLGLNTYDEYGKPGASNLGRYQYTGQKWVGEAGLYDYKARDYLPHLGIFAQTDPIGQVGGPNLYAYVGGDPINLIDPLGFDEGVVCIGDSCEGGVIITKMRIFGGGTLGGGTIRPSSPAPKPQPTKPKPAKLPYNPNINFCGAEGGTPLPNRVGNVSINDLCYVHDVCYGASGTARSVCDTEFGLAVFRRVGMGYFLLPAFPTSGSILGAISGGIAFGIVAVGGGPSYDPK